MRERIRDKERLEHILEASNKLLENKDKYTLEEIKANSVLFYGFVKLVEIIGEACYMLTKEFRESHPETNWKMIENMRHVLVHGYYAITPELLWATIHEDIQPLVEQINIYIKEEL
ncbi:MAG: DUF86 domain-containing protein [Paludibacteraceae bacterium]|nr:DUF86 domain-containing protein [Paludibacteraceae bacterium]